ncbi:hypothetical protein HYS49_00480 [Candidatus Woesearchaeota archaeon]|nr:hypothetical protein [Candidatus Woesearchaeota archaeon]
MTPYEKITIEELVWRAFSQLQPKREYTLRVKTKSIPKLWLTGEYYYLSVQNDVAASVREHYPRLRIPRNASDGDRILLSSSRWGVRKILQRASEESLLCELQGEFTLAKVGDEGGWGASSHSLIYQMRIDLQTITPPDFRGRLSHYNSNLEGALSLTDEGKLTLAKGEDDYDE